MANKQQKSSLLALLLLIVIALVAVFWFMPSLNEVSALQLENQNKTSQKVSLDKQVASLRAAKAEFKSTSEMTQVTSVAAIPEHFEEDKLINLISTLAKQNQVTVGSISFTANPNSTDVIKKGTINLSLTSSQRDLISFLKSIEGASRKMIVKNITVQLGKIQNVERVNFSLSIETYFQDSL